jgi:hypothetical protein
MIEIGMGFLQGLRRALGAWLSARYSWPLHYVGSIELYEGVFTAITLVALPRLWKRYFHHLEGSEVPLNLVKLSLGASIIGTTVLGFSFHRILAVIGLTILTCGAGFHDGLMAFVGSGMESREDISQVYLCIYIAQSLSSAFSGAAMGAFYSTVVRWNSFVGMGLPFWTCAVLFCGTRFLVQRL